MDKVSDKVKETDVAGNANTEVSGKRKKVKFEIHGEELIEKAPLPKSKRKKAATKKKAAAKKTVKKKTVKKKAAKKKATAAAS